jgi:hypothetical protein
VQHAGVLPGADQLAPWAAETERFVRSLISASFGLDLDLVSSALGVTNEELRTHVERAEDSLRREHAEASFEASWDAFQAARRKWAQQGGTNRGPLDAPFGHSPDFDEFRKANNLFREIEDRLDVSTFAPDIGEWVWFRRQHQESQTASPPTLEDARRALAFVLGWILRFESYSVRYPDERWRAWRQDKKAPRTGIPGGPHLTNPRVTHWKASQGSGYEWTFQVTDLPASEADFSSAISTASFQRGQNERLGSAYLAYDGLLTLRVPEKAPPAEALAIARELLAEGRAVLAARREIHERTKAEKESIALRFREAFDAQEFPASEIVVYLQEETRPGSAPTSVGLKLRLDQLVPAAAVDQIDWDLHNSLMLALADSSLDRGPNDRLSGHGASVQFPARWDPDEVIRWLRSAFEIAERRLAERTAELEASNRSLREAVAEVEALLRGDLPSG